MFILKRQDVEVTSFKHPSKEQKIPILVYQDQTFRLLSVFTAAQEEDARALWRDLTDNRGKACVLLEEPDRFSVWGKIRLDISQTSPMSTAPTNIPAAFVQACILLLQAIYEDIEDLLGARQAKSFEADFTAMSQQFKIPQATSSQSAHVLLTMDPFSGQLPAWQEIHLNLILKELHRIAKNYFGKSNFSKRALESLEDLTTNERAAFVQWLKKSPNSNLW